MNAFHERLKAFREPYVKRSPLNVLDVLKLCNELIIRIDTEAHL
jgi:hypothetical protein